MKKPGPTLASNRSTRVLALAAGLAKHELSHKIRATLTGSTEQLGWHEVRTRVAQARLLAESLGRLKGALMKAGQLLSMDASDFLPPEAIESLAKLQGQAEPVDFAVMQRVLASELGPDRLAALEQVDPQPAASASIGQVHRARAFGEAVAVKIQYPGIAESIDADLALLEKLGSSFFALTRREIELGDTFAELKSMLHLEADYSRERRYMDRFAVLLANDTRFQVPRSVAALSSDRVLTMSWAEGVPLHAWIGAAPPRGEREALGRALLDLYCMEFFRWGLVQTDPNPGNFLVQPGTNRIVLLDFGASMDYAPAFRESYVELLRSIATGHRERMVEEGVAFGLLDARESAQTREAFVDMLMSSVEPFNPSAQPFVFSDNDYSVRSRVVVQRFVRGLKYSPPPRRLIFLHRKLGGLFQVLKRLDLRLDLSQYWEQMVSGTERGAPSAGDA